MRKLIAIFGILSLLHLSKVSRGAQGNVEYSNGHKTVQRRQTTSQEGGRTDEQQCKCVRYYQCDTNNTVYDSSLTCNDADVCCRVDSAAQDTKPTKTCVCVPKSECLDKRPPPKLDLRLFQCAPGEVCCNSMITSTDVPRTVLDALSDVPLKPQAPICGVRKKIIDVRITDPGSRTMFGEFPWMAAVLKTLTDDHGIQIPNIYQCGGSLIYPSIVLTAAHCVLDTDAANLKVRVGEYNTDLKSREEPLPHQDRTVSIVSIHPDYDSTYQYNDIAFLITTEPFDITPNVNTVCLPTNTTSHDPERCLVTGWGKNATGPSGKFQTKLKRIDVPLVENEECERRLRTTRLGEDFQLHDSFLCAGGKVGKDACEGDGGGPLVCAVQGDRNRYVQVGIVSWGIGCGSDVPGVYTSTATSMNWLQSEIDKATLGIFRSLKISST